MPPKSISPKHLNQTEYEHPDPYLVTYYYGDEPGEMCVELHHVTISNPKAIANLVLAVQHWEDHGCGLDEALNWVLAEGTKAPDGF